MTKTTENQHLKFAVFTLLIQSSKQNKKEKNHDQKREKKTKRKIT